MLLSRFKIVGHSMTPTFRDGELVIVSSIPFVFIKPSIGDIVVFEKFGKYYVKRISKIEGDRYVLLGDNKDDSLDSRKLGAIERNNIKGKVIIKI